MTNVCSGLILDPPIIKINGCGLVLHSILQNCNDDANEGILESYRDGRFYKESFSEDGDLDLVLYQSSSTVMIGNQLIERNKFK